MRRFLAALMLSLSFGVPAAQAGDLTLRDVLELHRTGMGDDLLIAVVEADEGPLELSLADVQDLKGAGFSERLIAALVRASRKNAVPAGGGTLIERQDVYAPTYAPNFAPTFVYAPVVVVEAPPRRDEDAPGTPAIARTRPPATWVTRRSDGKNVSPRELKQD